MELFGTQLNPQRIAQPLHWWLDGLRACTEHRAETRCILHSGARGDLVVQGERYADLGAFLDAQLNDDLRRSGVVLSLPPEDLLVIRVELPLAAARNLADVLRYEMDRYTPFAAEQVYADHRVLARDAKHGRVHAELAVVRRERVDPLLQALEAHGVRVLAVQGAQLWTGSNLLPSGRRPARAWLRADMRWATGMLAALLLLAIAVTPLLQARAEVVALGQELGLVRAEVGDVLKLRQRLEQRRTLAQAVVDHGVGRHAAVDLLRELTRTLPDDTWLQSFELIGGKVEIQGESDLATDLIALLEAAVSFRDVSFRAPLVPVRNKNKERFAITMQLVDRSLE